jgi:WD40 repeat protein
VLLAACTPPTRWIAVAGGDSTIIFFNATLSQSDTLYLEVDRAGTRSVALAEFGRDGARLYTVGEGGSISLLRKLDGRELEHIEASPNELAGTLTALPDARTLINTTARADGTGGTLSLLTAETLEAGTRLTPCAGYPGKVTVLWDLNRAYTRCLGAIGQIADIDLKLRRVIKTVRISPADSTEHFAGACGNGGIDLSRTGTVLLVPCSSSGMLLYFDRLRLEPLDSVAAGSGVYHVAVSPNGSRAIVSFPDSGRVAFVDLRSRQVTTVIPTPGRPTDIAIAGDGRWGYVLTSADPGDPGILVLLDMDSERAISEASVPFGSRSLSLWPGRWSPSLRWE